jgi:hypothetical protein
MGIDLARLFIEVKDMKMIIMDTLRLEHIDWCVDCIAYLGLVQKIARGQVAHLSCATLYG